MGPELKEKTGYIWYVTVVCEDGKFYSSKPAFFETAIFSEDTWKGQWIGVENHEYGKAPRLCNDFFNFNVSLIISNYTPFVSVKQR